ncbi:MAG: FISUMP domain-containing protein [Thermodesulfobacteriota bacterium]
MNRLTFPRGILAALIISIFSLSLFACGGSSGSSGDDSGDSACTDGDGDGYSLEGGTCGLVDCDDTDGAINPGAAEVCGDGIDNDCGADGEATCPNPTVLSDTGKVWLDRNLGASQVAESPTDSAAYGDLYQWGRGADGHQLRTSSTTNTLSSIDEPGHPDFIVPPNSAPHDWREPQNHTLWQPEAGNNNVCPAGFRLPNVEEWMAERASWGSDDAAGAFASPLKLVLAGSRNQLTGIVQDEGVYGQYWSSTVQISETYSLWLESTVDRTNLTFPNYRAFGMSVRCIKD